jgi:hypothetical protein
MIGLFFSPSLSLFGPLPMIGLFFFSSSPACQLKLPGNILGENADKEPCPELEIGVGSKDQPRGHDQSGSQQRQGNKKSGTKWIGEAQHAEEHGGAPKGDGMHADLEIDITDPCATDGKKGAQQEMYGNGGRIGMVFEHHPCPPVKDHRDQVRTDPFFFTPQHGGLYQIQTPQKEDGKEWQESIAKDHADEPKDLCPMVIDGVGQGMNENDKRHHIGADEQRMKDNREKMR